ncbi:MAG: right-handed parallel beta-helix repeat-containing protein [Lachnospiraceae bacterium]|nr:right-handed parallel beta-helix repeat-containing protein [Lachnospiraceae bacterium]
MKKRVILAIVTVAMLAMTGCGGNAPAENPEPAENTENTEQDESNAEAKVDESKEEDQSQASGDISLDAMVGEWEFAYSLDHSDYSEGDSYDYYTMCDDPYCPESAIRVQKEGNQYIADYRYAFYESEYRYYGNKLSLKEEPAYKDCPNKDWYMEMEEPIKADDVSRRITMLDDETLIETEEYETTDEDYYFHSLSVKTYFKKDSPKFENKEEIRYFDTVTVSTAEELLNSIKNNTKIILEEGHYDLTAVPESAINNDALKYEISARTVTGISNLCIEGKEGAKVSVTISDPYDAVLSFQDGNNIVLRNLTVGHEVEPGYCSGSVLYYSGVSGIKVDKCNLYGSGTYGIDAYSCSYMDVTDCDIYECTYGLLSFSGVSTAHINNCTLRDSREYSMLSIDSCYDITFEDCTFKNNESTNEGSYFVQMSEYDDITFKKCSFTDNKYNIFSNYEVKMEDCQIENNIAKYSDIISTQKVDDASDLVAMYEQAKEKQDEMDKRITEDATLDQVTLNSISYESFDLWDTLLNRIWAYLGNTMDESSFESLSASQKEWVQNKEAARKAAGSEAEGGSMQPMLENSTAADWTRKRVTFLVEKYLK